MKNFNGMGKKLIALMLAVVLIAGILPISVFSDDAPDPTPAPEEAAASGTWGSSAKFEYEDGALTILLPANEIARLMSTKKFSSDDIQGMIPRDIKDVYDESGLIGMLLSKEMSEVIDLGEFISYFPDELFNDFFEKEEYNVVNRLKVVFGIRAEEDVDSLEPGVDNFTPELLERFHIKEILIEKIGEDHIEDYVNVTYIASHLKEELVNLVIENMDQNALSQMLKDAELDVDDFNEIMNLEKYPNLVNDFMTVVKEHVEDISKIVDTSKVDIGKKFNADEINEIISQLLEKEDLADILSLNLEPDDYKKLAVEKYVSKLISFLQDENVDFSKFIKGDIFSGEEPSEAAKTLLNKIKELSAEEIKDLFDLTQITADQLSKLSEDSTVNIFKALSDDEKEAIFENVNIGKIKDLLQALPPEKYNEIVEKIVAKIDADDFADCLKSDIDDLLQKYKDKYSEDYVPEWFNSEKALSDYLVDNPAATYSLSSMTTGERIKTFISYFSEKGTLANYILDSVKNDDIIVNTIVPKFVDPEIMFDYFQASDLFNIVSESETGKKTLVSAMCNHFNVIETKDLFVIGNSVENIIKQANFAKFVMTKIDPAYVLDNYIDTEEFAKTIANTIKTSSTSLFEKDEDTEEYKIISPKEFIGLGISYDHYVNISYVTNCIIDMSLTDSPLKIGEQTVDARYLVGKFGIEVIKLDGSDSDDVNILQYLFEKDGSGNYRVIHPKDVVEILKDKTEFRKALVKLIVNQIKSNKLDPQTIVNCYKDVINEVVKINEFVKLLPQYIFDYMTDDDKTYFSTEGNIDRSQFIDIVTDFIIKFICDSDSIKINTSFSQANNDANASTDLLIGATEEDKVKFFDSFALLGRTKLHTGEHVADTESPKYTVPVLSDETIPMYDGYSLEHISIKNVYKAILDAIPDISVFANIPEDRILASINMHFDLRQWLDDYYYDRNEELPDLIDVEAWEDAKKEIDFGFRIGLYVEDETATYGKEEKTAIEYIEDFVQRRIDAVNKYWPKSNGKIYDITLTDDSRNIDLNLVIEDKGASVISKILKSNKIKDQYKIDFINAINGKVGNFIKYLKNDLTTDVILEIIDDLNSSTLDSASDFIESNESRIENIRKKVISFFDSLSAKDKDKNFTEYFYRDEGKFFASGSTGFTADEFIKNVKGKNGILDRLIDEVINPGDKVTFSEDVNIKLENVYRIDFQDKNGIIKTAYLPAGIEISTVTTLFDNLNDDCKWYIINEKGYYEQITTMPAADTVVYKAYTVSFYQDPADEKTLVASRDFIHGATSILGYPPAVPFKIGTKSGAWKAYTLGDDNIKVGPDYELLDGYDVLWVVDEDNNLSTNSSIKYGQVPEFPYNEGTPEKDPDAKNTYTFDHWEYYDYKEEKRIPFTAAVAADFASEFPATPEEQEHPFTFYAVYNATVNTYTVTWNNYDGTLLEKDEGVEYGTDPSFDQESLPTKDSTVSKVYTFKEWFPKVEKVTGNATYTAVFSETTRQYKITWVDGNGNTIYAEDVDYNATPKYNKETYGVPTKAATSNYTYAFNNTWSPEIVAVTGDATYTAQFNENAIGGGTSVVSFKITWQNYDGTVLGIYILEEGKMPSYSGATPTKPEDDTYTYTFSGWEPSVSSATGDVTYTAVFTATKKEVKPPVEDGDNTATFINEDGSEVVIGYKDGEDPIDVAPMVPEKKGHDGYWEKHVDESGKEFYELVYVPQTYEVLFVTEDGTEIQVTYTYGTPEIKDPEIPEKFGYDATWEIYTLNDKKSISVRVIYTPKVFSVIFDYVGVEDKVEVVEYTYGAESIEEPEIPTKFMFSAAWEDYKLNEAESVKIQIVYTINLWWLIILLVVMIGVEIFIIIYNKKKKDKGNGEATKLGGGAFFLAGSIIRIIPNFGIIACIILGIAVIALAVVCIIVSLKKANDNADSVKLEDNKDEKKDGKDAK